MSALRSCPFCGGSRLENLDAAARGGSVMCIDCHAMGPSACDVEAAEDGFQAWNTRSALAVSTVGTEERRALVLKLGELAWETDPGVAGKHGGAVEWGAALLDALGEAGWVVVRRDGVT